jgi:hypothetical protein
MKKRRKNLILIIALLAVLLGVLIAIFFIGRWYYSMHFLPNTTINGINASDLTADEVRYRLQDKIREYTLTLEEREDTEKIYGEQLYMQYVDDGSVDQLLQDQKSHLWIFSFPREKKLTVRTGYTYDKDSIDTILDQLRCFQEGNVVEPEDAHIEENGDSYVVIEATQGTKLNREATKAAIEQAVQEGKTSINLAELGLYESAKQTVDVAELQQQCDTLNTMMKANITYDFKDRTKVVDSSVVKTFIRKNDDGNYALDENAVADWVIAMARETDTFGLSHSFKTSTGETIELASGGDYGWLIARDKTTQKLIADLKEGKTETIEPEYRYKGTDRSTNDIGGTYCEVNITQQRMWCYQDGQLIADTPVVTGNEAAGTCTPSGSVWAVDAKKADATFKTSGVHVDFWLPFNDGCGIHDASWRSNYGGSIYKSNGSHGCVNTPHDAAAKIFDVMKIGYPVIVYYSVDQVVGPQPTGTVTAG